MNSMKLCEKRREIIFRFFETFNSRRFQFGEQWELVWRIPDSDWSLEVATHLVSAGEDCLRKNAQVSITEMKVIAFSSEHEHMISLLVGKTYFWVFY